MMLLPKCKLADAQLLAEKIRLQIEQQTLVIEGNKITITASFGLCEYTDGASQSDVFEQVDKALYSAKSLGRNRVELA